MEENLRNKLACHFAELLDWVKSTAGEGEAFLRAQIPEVAHEIVAWTFWANSVVAFAFAVGTCVATVLICVSLSYATKMQSVDSGPATALVLLLGGSVCLGMTAGAMACLFAALKAKIAPRLTIIDKLKEMVTDDE